MERVPLFHGVPQESLTRLAERAGEIDFEAGQHIVNQGQIGNGLYVIMAGEARIQRGDEEIAVLGQGDFFGELSVLDQKPRSASAVAVTDVSFLGLASWDLMAEIEHDPKLALNLLRELAGRIRYFEDRYVH
jgi:CRP/FNR family transcriptional regulator